jgi:micrococcal nuclease
MIMRTAVAVAVFFLLILPTAPFAGEIKVVRVTDGDTIKARSDSKKIIVRLVGIDAPETSKKKNEPGQPYSRKATQYLAGLLLNKIITMIEYGIDQYGRILGVIFVNDTNANLEMLKAGLAEVYRGPPAKGLALDPYWKAEEEARKAKRGMWVLGDKYVSPREWRKSLK